MGPLLISGYHHLSGEDDDWSMADALAAPVFSSTASRKRFRRIKSCKLVSSKMEKELLLFEEFKSNCSKLEIFCKIMY